MAHFFSYFPWCVPSSPLFLCIRNPELLVLHFIFITEREIFSAKKSSNFGHMHRYFCVFHCLRMTFCLWLRAIKEKTLCSLGFLSMRWAMWFPGVRASLVCTSIQKHFHLWIFERSLCNLCNQVFCMFYPAGICLNIIWRWCILNHNKDFCIYWNTCYEKTQLWSGALFIHLTNDQQIILEFCVDNKTS